LSHIVTRQGTVEGFLDIFAVIAEKDVDNPASAFTVMAITVVPAAPSNK
jgi:hypothetical protein